MSRIKQNVFGNMINTTEDLEWFMVNFIRHYSEMAETIENCDGDIENPASLKENLDFDKELDEKLHKKLQEDYDKLLEAYKIVVEHYLDLYGLFKKTSKKIPITKADRKKHREFSRMMYKELLDVTEEIELPF